MVLMCWGSGRAGDVIPSVKACVCVETGTVADIPMSVHQCEHVRVSKWRVCVCVWSERVQIESKRVLRVSAQLENCGPYQYMRWLQ